MSRARSKTATSSCPCGSGRDYDACCGRFHAGAPAPDAEALMRSRYCAYVRGNADYLLATWHPATRPPQLDLAGEPPVHWLGLQVRRHTVTGADAAIVEFVARYRIGNRAQRLHETSRFVREDGRWCYLDGEFSDREGPA
jgi:SEC-C motif-containing protein